MYSDSIVTLELAYDATGLVTYYNQFAPNNTTGQGHTNIYTYNFSKKTSPGQVAGANIVLQNVNNGDVAFWQMSGTSINETGAPPGNPPPSWQVVGFGDFFGNGFPSDIIFQDINSGEVLIWEMNGTSVIGGGGPTLGGVLAIPGPGWKVVGTGNFYGSGLSDIIFQNPVNGQVLIWEMSGTTIIGGDTLTLGGAVANPGSGWRVVGTGDFHGRGLSDIIFQNTINGQILIWEMSGTTIIGGGPLTLGGAVANPGATWQILGTGDFTGVRLLAKSSGPVPPLPYGIADMVLQNNDGEIIIWEINGTTIVGGGVPVDGGGNELNPGPTWKVVGTGDFFGTGRSDLLLQSVDALQNLNDQPPVIWEMDGTSVIGGGGITNPGPGWLLHTSNELLD
jgi:hypothetical protein